ncbi:proteinase [Acrocarpospora corrugata]|uniref:Proteinase n=1 Tax=Acrocarpospora corrugata TaxID=35763 RepID=A0A5M3VMX4_9ACTN|nr:alpha/beta hydrolase [Acrocarpospora corrugata]GER98134.1 proteinase [Acrocarpospora corrugata]
MGRAARTTTTLAVAILAAALVLPQAALADVPPTYNDGKPPASETGDQPARGDEDMPPAPAGLEGYYTQQLIWTDCERGVQCAKLTVPLDYARPEADQIQIAVLRLPSTGEGEKIGSLLTNPGGPGRSGVEFVFGSAPLFQRLRRDFDVIGFDPRGVNVSTPIDCLSDKERDAEIAADITPETKAEIRFIENTATRFVRACRTRSPKLIGHIGTMNAARDMDILRAALGDPKMSYLGFSYGTYLGTVYAHLFPNRIRALVLDGAMDPTKSQAEQGASQGDGFAEAYVSFLKDCFKRKDCPFRGRGTDADLTKAVERTNAMFLKADKTPFRTTVDDRRVTLNVALWGWRSALYSKFSWPQLRVTLAQAFRGDGTGLIQFSDLYFQRAANGTYTNADPAFRAINCLDNPRPKRNKFDECSLWPAAVTPVPRSMHAKGAPPILVVGTTRDPATPYHEAVALAKHLTSGVLLTNDDDGHTAYGNSFCSSEVIDTYLITLKTPKKGFVCKQEAQV